MTESLQSREKVNSNMKHIYKCTKCETYTMKDTCCDTKTINPKPAKYSPSDKYAKYRRDYKKNLE